jgi:diguanylate cyclase (GGDEF)-like protein
MQRLVNDPAPDAAVRSATWPLQQHRRTEDQELRLLLADVPEADTPGGLILPLQHGVALRAYRLEGDGEPQPVPLSERLIPASDSVFVLDAGGEEAILIFGATVRRVPRRDGGQDLLDRATSGALAWKRELLRSARQVRRADQVIAFADRLSVAKSKSETIRTLCDFVTRIIGGFTTLVLERERDEELMWPAEESAGLSSELWSRGIPFVPRFMRSGLITAEDARPDTGAPFAALSSLFSEERVAAIAHQPLDEQRIVCLLERRDGRIFEPEDWDLFRTLTRMAGGALERIRLHEEVHQLSLSDPLTGLANRRHLRVMLEHSMAAARRGEPLTLLLIDLDGFKAVNDQLGHLRGDRILRLVADRLREQARGSDLVVRYGGDEFIVVLNGDIHAAEAYLQRVREQLDGHVRFTAGSAEYRTGIHTGDQLIELADRSLYRLREARQERDRVGGRAAREENRRTGDHPLRGRG